MCEIPEYTAQVVPLSEYQALCSENEQLKLELQDANQRNMALQKVIVKHAFAEASVPFVSMNGGRLYEGNTFVNKTQCAVLDNTHNPAQFLTNLLQSIFSRDILKESSITGEKSRRSKQTNSKPALDPVKLNLIYNLMKEKTANSADYTHTKINKIIAKKINNLAGRKSKQVDDGNESVEITEDYSDDNNE
ncbi:hypothetical protein HA402_009729 [Bradysia odoriphaga]|nr:hypothetical protein HA402_009729 [Bradysia odoriphaga]